MQKDIVVGITSDALSDSLTYGLHHTLTNALSDSLAADLTPPTMHYYYCVYCYYYGNFCDFCYRYDELTYMHRLWGFGQGKSEDCGSPRGIGAIVAKDTAPPTKGDKVTSPAPEAPRKDKQT